MRFLTVCCILNLMASSLASLGDTPTNNIPSYEGPLFAWDLHEVVLTKNRLSIVAGLWNIVYQHQPKWELIQMFLDPTFWIFLYEAKKSVVITDDFIDAVIVRYPFLKKHSHTLFSIINDFSVNQNVLDLIDTLRMQGYKNIIASNITDRSWRITERKHPELHNHFDGIFTVDTQKITGVFYTRSGKPHKDYYIALREYSKYEGYGYDVPIIFIDDRQSNIDGAHRAQVGIQGIIFRGVDRLKHMLAPWL